MSGLRLTPENLAAAYAFLKTTMPFCRWRLPDADEVRFSVYRHQGFCGDYRFLKGRHHIRISETCIGRTVPLIAVMAHEMVHVKCQMRGDKSTHGAMLNRYGRIVCKHHGFDPKLF